MEDKRKRYKYAYHGFHLSILFLAAFGFPRLMEKGGDWKTFVFVSLVVCADYLRNTEGRQFVEVFVRLIALLLIVLAINFSREFIPIPLVGDCVAFALGIFIVVVYYDMVERAEPSG